MISMFNSLNIYLAKKNNNHNILWRDLLGN